MRHSVTSASLKSARRSPSRARAAFPEPAPGRKRGQKGSSERPFAERETSHVMPKTVQRKRQTTLFAHGYQHTKRRRRFARAAITADSVCGDPSWAQRQSKPSSGAAARRAGQHARFAHGDKICCRNPRKPYFAANQRSRTRRRRVCGAAGSLRKQDGATPQQNHQPAIEGVYRKVRWRHRWQKTTGTAAGSVVASCLQQVA